MGSLNERIQERLRATGKSYRRASLDGGLSAEAISKILSTPANSPTLETIRKLATGLDTSPEWLAYGVGAQGQPDYAAKEGPDRSAAVNAEMMPHILDIADLPDSASIHVEVGALRRVVSGALQSENIPEEQADAHADAVLVSLIARLTSFVGYRLEESSRTVVVSSKRRLAGRR